MTHTTLVHYLRVTLLLAALLVAVPSVTSAPAYAQSDHASLTDYIAQNENLLGEVRDIVSGTSSVKARLAFDAAQRLHESSKDQLSNDRPVLARAAARKARELILKALATAKSVAILDQGALSNIERARGRLEQARETYDSAGGNNNAAVKLMDESQQQLQRAESSVREHLFEVAGQLAGGSFKLATQAIQLLREDGGGSDRLLRELERTDSVLERVRDSGKLDNPRARQAFADATAQQDRARQSLQQGQPRVALQLTRNARAIAGRIASSGGNNQGGDDAQHFLETTDEVLRKARDVVADSDNNAASSKLAEAVDLQNRAKSALASGNPKRAVRLSSQARDIASELLRRISLPVDEHSVGNALNTTDRVIAELEEQLGRDPSSDAADLLRRAKAQQQQARGAFNQSELRKALAKTRAARNLARRGLALLDGRPR